MAKSKGNSFELITPMLNGREVKFIDELKSLGVKISLIYLFHHKLIQYAVPVTSNQDNFTTNLK